MRTPQVKPLLMAVYFGADHVVWASQAGLLADKETTRRAQKASFYGWLGGSVCTVASELFELSGALWMGLGLGGVEGCVEPSELGSEASRPCSQL